MPEFQYLRVPEALVIYAEIIRASRVEAATLGNLPGLESALAQPQQTFDGNDLYPGLEQKAAALMYSLCQNHPFADGNKRLAFTATRTFLRLNGMDLDVQTSAAAEFMTAMARGEISVEKATEWISDQLVPFEWFVE